MRERIRSTILLARKSTAAYRSRVRSRFCVSSLAARFRFADTFVTFAATASQILHVPRYSRGCAGTFNRSGGSVPD